MLYVSACSASHSSSQYLNTSTVQTELCRQQIVGLPVQLSIEVVTGFQSGILGRTVNAVPVTAS